MGAESKVLNYNSCRVEIGELVRTESHTTVRVQQEQHQYSRDNTTTVLVVTREVVSHIAGCESSELW